MDDFYKYVLHLPIYGYSGHNVGHSGHAGSYSPGTGSYSQGTTPSAGSFIGSFTFNFQTGTMSVSAAKPAWRVEVVGKIRMAERP